MIIHVTNEEDAKILIKWAYKCGYKWADNSSLSDSDVFYSNYKEETCYAFITGYIYCDKTSWHKYITQFSDLIVSEYNVPETKEAVKAEETTSEKDRKETPMVTEEIVLHEGTDTVKIPQNNEHMTAEEILEWIANAFYINPSTKAWVDVFGTDVDLYGMLHDMKASEAISKIEAYENREKEPEVKWVWRVFGIDGFDEEFFDVEEDAIARCEKLVKSQKGDKFAKCEKVCKIKK